MKERSRDLEVHPVTPERWHDLEKLFGPSGADGGCWCMWFRLRRMEFDRNSGKENKRALRQLVDSGEPPGLLGYVDGEPAGWVSLAPRKRFAHLEHSRKLKKVDERPVWSIVCFVIAKSHRGQGLMTKLLSAALDYARDHGATIIEGYPVEPEGRLTGFAGYTGIASAYRKAGFVEVARPSNHQLIMRYSVGSEPTG
jgi:GNAT superfamily N-acetyltransferase